MKYCEHERHPPHTSVTTSRADKPMCISAFRAAIPLGPAPRAFSAEKSNYCDVSIFPANAYLLYLHQTFNPPIG